MQVTPGMELSIFHIFWPRRSNAERISATAVRSPLTAASAAICDTFATLDVVCDWKLIAAFMTSFGPIIQPTRQPVMAYVLATPFSTRHWPASSGTRAGMDANVCPPNVRCS